MTETIKKKHDLEERTLIFAKDVIKLCKELPKDTINNEIIKQLIRASGSVGANYREANEALSKKDFVHKMKISRKECKECSYWLELLKEANSSFTDKITGLLRETVELRNILSVIINKI